VRASRTVRTYGTQDLQVTPSHSLNISFHQKGPQRLIPVENSLLTQYDATGPLNMSRGFWEHTMDGLEPSQRDRNLGVLLHLSSFAGILIPYGGFVVPIVIWLVYKESDFVNQQGFIFLNGLISYTIYGVVSGLLCWILIGFPLLVALAVIAVWGPIRAALAARDGGLRQYPLVIKSFG
jgi:uncharacterized protein